MSASPASALSSLENPPPGANDFSCKPSADHPRPLVLVHGLGATMGANWSYMSPLLKQRGYCVFALTYGIDPRTAASGGPGGVIPIQQSAGELDAFVRRVLSSTGARKVDLFGHSEGTFMPQYWLKFMGGAAKVDKYVALTPLYGGTKLAAIDQIRDTGAGFGLSRPLVDSVSAFCGSCPQFVAGSEMQKMLVAGGAAAKGVTYTTIPTRYDELVIPYTSGLLPPPATNRVVQDSCPADASEHVAVAFDPVVAQLAFNALDPPDARPVDCSRLPPYNGRRGSGSRSGKLIGAGLSAKVRRFKVRRLTVTRLPAGARVKVTCKAPRARRGHRSRSCAFASRTRRAHRSHARLKLVRLFHKRTLRRGTTIRVKLTKPGLRGKLFTVTVRRNGRAKVRRRCLSSSGARARC